MIINQSRRVQRAAQPHLMRYSFHNGLGFSLSLGSVVFLLALHYGASDTQMGLLYSAIYITGMASILVPSFLNGKETTATIRNFWWARAIVSVGYLFLPLLAPGQGRIWTLLGIYYLFGFLRAFGVGSWQSILRSLTSPRTLPEVLGRVFVYTRWAIFLAGCISYFLLREGVFSSDEKAFMVLLALGVVFNSLSSYELGKLPRSGYLEKGSFGGLFKTARTMLGNRQQRHILALVFVETAVILCASYHINYLRRDLAFTNGDIFLITTVSLLGAIAMATGLRIMGPHVSPRAFLVVAYVMAVVMGAIWASTNQLSVPAVVPMYIVFFLVSSLVVSSTGPVVTQIQTTHLPRGENVQASVIYNITAVLSSVCTLGLIRVLGAYGSPFLMEQGFHSYSHIFFLRSVLAFVACVVVIRMGRGAKSGILEELSMLTPANMMAMYKSYRLEGQEETPVKRLGWEGLMVGSTSHSRKLLLEFLESPDESQRYPALRMAIHSAVPEAFPLIAREAQSVDSPFRPEAITALGFLPGEETVKVLTGLMQEEDARIQACALKSLLRLGGAVEDGRILDLYKRLQDTRARLNIIVGLASAHRRDVVFRILAFELERKPGLFWARILFQWTAGLDDRRETMAEIFLEEGRKPGTGLEYFLTDFEGKLPEGLQAGDLRSLFEQQDYAALTARLKTHVDGDWLRAQDRISALGVLFLWGIAVQKAKNG